MDDDQHRSTEDAKDHFKQGIGLLWRAAREAATGFKKELNRAGVAKVIDDAGREFTRAASNVVERLGEEIKKVQPGEPRYVRSVDPQDPHPWKYDEPAKPDEEGYRAPGKKPTGPTPDDPGFRIATSESSDDKPQ